MDCFNYLAEFLVLVASAIVSAIITYYLTIKSIDYEHALRIGEKKTSQDKLLKLAKKYYEEKDYISVASIYSKKKLKDSAIALSNTAYMFEHGILFKRDLAKARELYKRASEFGYNEDVFSNWLRFYIHYPATYTELISLIRKGYYYANKVAESFILEYFPENEDYSVSEFLLQDEAYIIGVLTLQQYEMICDDDVAKVVGKEFITNVKVDRINKESDVGKSIIEYRIFDGKHYLAKYRLISETESVENKYYHNVFYFSTKKENVTHFI